MHSWLRWLLHLADFQVDLELPGWKEVEDVSGDGGVVKKTLVSTKEWKVRSTVH